MSLYLSGVGTSSLTSTLNSCFLVWFCSPYFPGIRCPPLPESGPYVNVNFKSFDYDSNATFNCPVGFRLFGEERIKCLATGNWSHDVPSCVGKKIFCNVPFSFLFFFATSSLTSLTRSAVIDVIVNRRARRNRRNFQKNVLPQLTIS